MLNTIVQTDVSQIKCVFVIIFLQHLRCKIGREVAEGLREVICCLDIWGHVFEGYVPAITGKNAYLNVGRRSAISNSATYHDLPMHSKQDMRIGCRLPSVRCTQATCPQRLDDRQEQRGLQLGLVGKDLQR